MTANDPRTPREANERRTINNPPSADDPPDSPKAQRIPQEPVRRDNSPDRPVESPRNSRAENTLEDILAAVRDAARNSGRRSLRRHARAYRRDARALFAACFPASRPAVLTALAAPGDASATRRLCRALWRDLQCARALPRYLTGRPLRIAALRLLFAGECTRYLRQRDAAAAMPSARPPLTTGDWLSGLCRAIEAGPAPAPRARRRPRGPVVVAQRSAITARSRARAADTGSRRRR